MPRPLAGPSRNRDSHSSSCRFEPQTGPMRANCNLPVANRQWPERVDARNQFHRMSPSQPDRHQPSVSALVI